MAGLSRRDLLRGAVGVGATLPLAGCSLFGGARYTLQSRPETGASPLDLFEWRPASNAFHYDREHVQSLARDLRETGTVDSVEIPLVEPRPSGESGYRPAYTQRDDGTHARVRVREDPVTLDRWTVWMEPLDALPDGAEYTTTPREGLSAFDTEIVERVIDRAVSAVRGDREQAAQRAPRRGVVFFDPLDPEESDLVPDPPFEYALVEPRGHGTPDELPLRLHVGREPVETARYRHELDPISADPETVREHLRETHVAATFGSDAGESDAGEEIREILDASTELTGYDEREPLSEAFRSILVDLNLEDATVPEDREVASWLRYYAVDGDYYAADLLISTVSPI